MKGNCRRVGNNHARYNIEMQRGHDLRIMLDGDRTESGVEGVEDVERKVGKSLKNKYRGQPAEAILRINMRYRKGQLEKGYQPTKPTEVKANSAEEDVK